MHLPSVSRRQGLPGAPWALGLAWQCLDSVDVIVFVIKVIFLGLIFTSHNLRLSGVRELWEPAGEGSVP